MGRYILFLFILFGVFALLDADGVLAEDISTCTNITESSDLIANIGTTGTCLIINVSNIVLDGKGYRLNYSGSGASNVYGINITRGVQNVTIRNFNITENMGGLRTNHAIVANFSNGNYSNITISNSTIRVYSNQSVGIFFQNVTRSSIISNVILLNGTESEGILFNGTTDANGDYSTTGITHHHLVVYNNTINASLSGIHLMGCITCNVTQNVVNATMRGTSSAVAAAALYFDRYFSNLVVFKNTLFTYSSDATDAYGLLFADGPVGGINGAIGSTNLSLDGNVINVSSAATQNTYGVYIEGLVTAAFFVHTSVTTAGINSYALSEGSSSSLAVANATFLYGNFTAESTRQYVISEASANNGGVITLINLTGNLNRSNFNVSTSSTGSISLLWDLQAKVYKNSTGTPYSSVNVTAYNLTSNTSASQVANANTDSLGLVTLRLTEFVSNATSTFYSTPHTIIANDSSDHGNSLVVNLTTNNASLVTLLLTVPTPASTSSTTSSSNSGGYPKPKNTSISTELSLPSSSDLSLGREAGRPSLESSEPSASVSEEQKERKRVFVWVAAIFVVIILLGLGYFFSSNLRSFFSRSFRR